MEWDRELDSFYITGQGRVIHWECDWSCRNITGVASQVSLNGLARAHLRKGCGPKRRYLTRQMSR